MRQLRTNNTNIPYLITLYMITHKTSATTLLYTHNLYFGMIMPRNNKVR